MKDVDRSKLYNGRMDTTNQHPSDPSPEEKELLVLEARLEKASGEDRVRIEELIRETIQKMEREGKTPPQG